jgi:membrane fusion protein, copper/silver efflux system
MNVFRKIRSVVLFLVVLALGVTLGVIGRARVIARLDRVIHPHPASTAVAPAVKQLWTCAMHPQVIKEEPGNCPICNMPLEPMHMDTASAGTPPQQRERKIKYWWDPMYNPPYISNRPGKSPMGMDLLPVYEDEISAGTPVKIDPVVVQNMGVRVAKVVEGPLHSTVRTVSYLMEPEQNHTEINLRVSGWIQKLYADYDGKEVAVGDPLFDLYSPDLEVAVDELIAARRGRDSVPADADATLRQSADALYNAAQRKLELLGLDAAAVAALAKLEKAPATVTFRSPRAGHITEKAVIEGAAVKSGDRVMVVANRQDMWLEVQIYEHQLPYVRLGTPVRARLAALPDKVLTGNVTFIYPHIDPMSRTARVRITVPNASHDLHEGMYATADIDVQIAPRTLMVPREAVLDSGVRQIVFVAEEGGEAGHFSPRKVTVGEPGNDGMLQIVSGLAPGETVVTSGQFLLDSESRMKEAIQKHLSERLLAPGTQVAAAPAATHPAETMPAAATMPSSKQADAVFLAYLDMMKSLGKVQSGSDPADFSALKQAATQLIATPPDSDANTLGQRVLQAATSLEGQTIDQQRKNLIPLGDAVIALADHIPPSAAVAEKLYVIKCPMTGGSWLQIDDNIANPFFAATMKTCGGVVRTIPAGGAK